MNKLANWGKTTGSSQITSIRTWFCFRLPLVEEIITNYTLKFRGETKYTACIGFPWRIKNTRQQQSAKWYNYWNPSSHHLSSMGPPPVMWRRCRALEEICHRYLKVINWVFDVQLRVPPILYMVPEATEERSVCREKLLWYWDPKLFSQLFEIGRASCRERV